MTNPVVTPPPARKRSWLLIVSLALNLLVLGAVAGTIAAHRAGFGGPPDLNIGRLLSSEQGLRGFVRSLPRDRRGAIQAAIDLPRKQLPPLREAVRLARQEANQALGATPFDPQRFEKAMSDLGVAESSARRAGVAVLTAAVSQMTPAEREQFQSWRRRHEHFGPPGREPPGGEKTDAGPPPR